MLVLPLLLLALSGLPSTSSGQAASKRVLLSIAPPRLSKGEFIDKFKFDLEGATVLATCHIPFGWQVTAGMFDSNSGELSGEGGLGGSLISTENANFVQFQNVFLIEMNPGAGHPKITGSIEIGHYGADEHHHRRVKSPARLYVLSPATDCPPTRQ